MWATGKEVREINVLFASDLTYLTSPLNSETWRQDVCSDVKG
jgi:hypothetical protein